MTPDDIAVYLLMIVLVREVYRFVLFIGACLFVWEFCRLYGRYGLNFWTFYWHTLKHMVVNSKVFL